jgi:hypothetical protein
MVTERGRAFKISAVDKYAIANIGVVGDGRRVSMSDPDAGLRQYSCETVGPSSIRE